MGNLHDMPPSKSSVGIQPLLLDEHRCRALPTAALVEARSSVVSASAGIALLYSS